MKIGFKLPNSGPLSTAENMKRAILAGEDLGYDMLWVHDHISWRPSHAEWHFVAGTWEGWGDPIVPNVFESVTALSYAAGLTSRIGIGTSVVVLPLRNPCRVREADGHA